MSTPRIFKMTATDYWYGDENSEGRCSNCGEKVYGVEPDASEYKCDTCGENAVYGLEQLMFRGQIIIEEE